MRLLPLNLSGQREVLRTAITSERQPSGPGTESHNGALPVLSCLEVTTGDRKESFQAIVLICRQLPPPSSG